MLKVLQINACDSTASTGTVMRQIARVRGLAIDPESPRQWVEERFSMVRNYIRIYRSLQKLRGRK